MNRGYPRFARGCPWEFLVTWRGLQDVFSTNHCNATTRSCVLLAFGFDMEMSHSSLSDFSHGTHLKDGRFKTRTTRASQPQVLQMAYKHSTKSNDLPPNLFANRS